MNEGGGSAGAEARQAAESAARRSYGRLVALLAYRWRDLAGAEDALSEAFASALRHWPRSGVPASPEAWLMTAAKRELLQHARHKRLAQDPAVTALFDADAAAPTPEAVPDERLKLLFVCAHPALPEPVRAPLMLQAVLGLEARVIASAFLVSPAAMAQRLVRAKAKIRDAGLRFEEPEARELPERLHAVLESIYAAYTIGQRRAGTATDAGAGIVPHELSEEALYLCRVVTALLPTQPEPAGLLALMLYCEARRPAQFDASGSFVPLGLQDCARWQRDRLSEAEAQLAHAARFRQPGAFQLEAAIQSAHCQRAFTGQTPWGPIAHLYGILVQHFPSLGAQVGEAVALAEAGDLQSGLARLGALPAAAVREYAPYWVALAHLCGLDGRPDARRAALTRALGLTPDARVRAYLETQLRAAATAAPNSYA